MIRVIIILFFSVNIFSQFNNFNTNTDTVWAGGYKYPQTSDPTLGSNNEFFFYHQKNRIRQNGSITKIQMYFTGSGCSEISIKFWRKKDNSTFDYVGSTGNIIGQLVSGQITTFRLAAPVYVQEGDYYSIRINSSGLNLAGTEDGDGECYYQGGDAGTSNTSWLTKFPYGTYDVNIRFFMRAPAFVIIGNSIAAGYNESSSFCENWPVTGFESTIGFNLASLLSCTYQNMGIGGQTTSEIRSRFKTDLTDMKPLFAVIEGGVNDVYYDLSTQSILNNFSLMIDSCSANKITAFVIGILPWTKGTNLHALKIDSINTQLKAMCKTKGAYFIDCRASVGQPRFYGIPPPPPGNHWDINIIYRSGDGVHFNAAGYLKIAEISASAIQSAFGNIFTPGIPSGYLLMQNYPNPFNPFTVINFSVPFKEHVTLKIYNVLAELVKAYDYENLSRGSYNIIFYGSNHPSGVYFYTLRSGENVITKKMILMK